MLVEFRVRNYMCFRDEQVLSLVASSDDSLPDNVITPPALTKLRLLRSAVIYGPNASGKSKLLDALSFVWDFVLHSAKRKPDDVIRALPFLLDSQSATAPSEFEITFIDRAVRYQYGIVVDGNRVYQEYLYAAPRGRTVTWFERAWNAEMQQEEYVFGPSLKGKNQEMRGLTRKNALFLSVAAAFNHPMLSSVYAWFSAHIQGVHAPFLFWDPLRRVDDSDHQSMQSLLRSADLGILDYRIREMPRSRDERDIPLPDVYPSAAEPKQAQADEKWTQVEMLHLTSDQQAMSLPLVFESSGTLQLFALGGDILKVLGEGKVLFVDELDSSLHPVLARALVELFHDPTSNQHDAQLIFNTHDTTLLDPSLFRRDQIWFTEKEPTGVARLYPLLEYSPRREEALAKGYLQGRYGAVPFVGDLSSALIKGECDESPKEAVGA